MSNSTGFEFIERPSSRSCPSSPSSPNERPSSRSSFQDKRSPSSSDSVTMWIQLEGAKDSDKLDIPEDFFNKKYVYDLKSILCENFDDLKKYERQKRLIELYSLSSGEFLPANETLASLKVKNSTDILVRYPISAVNIKVTFMYGRQKSSEYEIPHHSGSFVLLKNTVTDIFKDLQTGTFHFSYEKAKTKHEIRNEYNFNILVSREVNNGECTLTLKVVEEGKKSYSLWKLEEAFRDILKKDYKTLGEIPKFSLESDLPPVESELAENEFNHFREELGKHLKSVKQEFGDNETSTRFIIDTFISTAVCHVQDYINDSAKLSMEKELAGSRGYGPIDYVVEIAETFVLICEAKLEDMKQGTAQNIVQLHSAIEQQSGKRKHGQEETAMYGIVTTGKLWRFIRWTGSLSEPIVHISKEYTCSFIDNHMKMEKDVIMYIVQILQAQAKAYDKGDKNDKGSPSKRHCSGLGNY